MVKYEKFLEFNKAPGKGRIQNDYRIKGTISQMDLRVFALRPDEVRLNLKFAKGKRGKLLL